MPFILTDIGDIGTGAYQLTLANDGRLWFCDLCQCDVRSIDLATWEVTKHFEDAAFCKLWFNGERGFIGTIEGQVLTFSVQDAIPRPLLALKDKYPIGTLTYDEEFQTLSFGSGRMIYQADLQGNLRMRFRCSMPSFSILYAHDALRLWSVCDGYEIFDLETGESTVGGRRHLCGYCQVLRAPDGSVACFGGDIDFYTVEGKHTRAISGDFNRGVFSPSGRLMVNRVGEMPEQPTITSASDMGFDYDVIWYCDSHIIDNSANRIIASYLDKLFVFRKS